MTTKPVWVWRPGSSVPVRAGEYTLKDKLGSFSYDKAFRDLADAVPLDPVHLPFLRSQRPLREVGQEGLFGVFRDASPEGFGLSMLEATLGANLTLPLERLEASVGDAVGAIEVCDDIERKLAWQAPESRDLVVALTELQPEESSTTAARNVMRVDGTSLGGERPKITVRHEGQLWIAKMQLRGDPPHAPLREYAAMQSAAAAGINVAETKFVRAGSRELLLVRRFDREVLGDGAILRRLYASAHTVLGLQGAETRGDVARSYVAFAQEIRRWSAREGVSPLHEQRELFRRMLFNAVCGNGDDHPRNHGMIFDGEGWKLSPAFDIAPYITFSETLAMAVNRAGESAATASKLVRDCESFGYGREEAIAYLREAVDAMAATWPRAVRDSGFEPDELPVRMPKWLEIDAAATEAAPKRRLRGGRA
jgi:serine/threonine-protein kinase HipA